MARIKNCNIFVQQRRERVVSAFLHSKTGSDAFELYKRDNLDYRLWQDLSLYYDYGLGIYKLNLRLRKLSPFKFTYHDKIYMAKINDSDDYLINSVIAEDEGPYDPKTLDSVSESLWDKLQKGIIPENVDETKLVREVVPAKNVPELFTAGTKRPYQLIKCVKQ